MFSVIIPVHNKLPHLERSINSVLNQSFQDFELLLIDDASTDGSTEKLLEFNDPRIRRFRREEPSPGGYAARNLGIEKAKYEWICFLDADDEWNLKHLEEKFKIIEKEKDVEVVSVRWSTSNNGIISENKRFKKIREKIKLFTLIDFLNYNSIMWTSAISIKKEVLETVKGFPVGKCTRGGDLDTWIRCLDISKKNIFLNKGLAIYYRDTVNQVTNTKSNPFTGKFCTEDSLQKIRNKTNNKQLHKAIDNFNSKFIYLALSNNRKSKIETPIRTLVNSSYKRQKLRIKLFLSYYYHKVF